MGRVPVHFAPTGRVPFAAPTRSPTSGGPRPSSQRSSRAPATRRGGGGATGRNGCRDAAPARTEHRARPPQFRMPAAVVRNGPNGRAAPRGKTDGRFFFPIASTSVPQNGDKQAREKGWSHGLRGRTAEFFRTNAVCQTRRSLDLAGESSTAPDGQRDPSGHHRHTAARGNLPDPPARRPAGPSPSPRSWSVTPAQK